MKTLIITTTLVATLAGIAAPAQARDALENAVKTTIELQDGSTLYVFKDGRMAKEDSFGRAVFLKAGETLKARTAERSRPLATKLHAWIPCCAMVTAADVKFRSPQLRRARRLPT